MRRCVGIHVGAHPRAVRATVPILLNTTHMVAITVNLNTIVSESLDIFFYEDESVEGTLFLVYESTHT